MQLRRLPRTPAPRWARRRCHAVSHYFISIFHIRLCWLLPPRTQRRQRVIRDYASEVIWGCRLCVSFDVLRDADYFITAPAITLMLMPLSPRWKRHTRDIQRFRHAIKDNISPAPCYSAPICATPSYFFFFFFFFIATPLPPFRADFHMPKESFDAAMIRYFSAIQPYGISDDIAARCAFDKRALALLLLQGCCRYAGGVCKRRAARACQILPRISIVVATLLMSSTLIFSPFCCLRHVPRLWCHDYARRWRRYARCHALCWRAFALYDTDFAICRDVTAPEATAMRRCWLIFRYARRVTHDKIWKRVMAQRWAFCYSADVAALICYRTPARLTLYAGAADMLIFTPLITDAALSGVSREAARWSMAALVCASHWCQLPLPPMRHAIIYAAADDIFWWCAPPPMSLMLAFDIAFWCRLRCSLTSYDLLPCFVIEAAAVFWYWWCRWIFAWYLPRCRCRHAADGLLITALYFADTMNSWLPLRCWARWLAFITPLILRILMLDRHWYASFADATLILIADALLPGSTLDAVVMLMLFAIADYAAFRRRYAWLRRHFSMSIAFRDYYVADADISACCFSVFAADASCAAALRYLLMLTSCRHFRWCRWSCHITPPPLLLMLICHAAAIDYWWWCHWCRWCRHSPYWCHYALRWDTPCW